MSIDINKFREQYFGEKPKQEVQIPTGGEGLPSLGFIGPVYNTMAYRMWTLADVSEEGFSSTVPQPDFRRKTKNGWFNYWLNGSEASAAQKALGETNNPQLMWLFRLNTSEVLNSPNLTNLIERWGDTISSECQVATVRSKKHRHEFLLISMPAMVAAMAQLMGFETPGFKLDELLVRDAIVNDEFQLTMIGDIDRMDMLNSVLGKRRIELWKALGEEDPLRYLLSSSKAADEKMVARSDKLRACLEFVFMRSEQPMWARFYLATDPRVAAGWEAESGWVNNNLPVVGQVFIDKDAAMEAAKEDLKKLAEAGVEIVEGAVQTNAKEPPLPDKWQGMKETFVDMLVTPFLGKTDAEVKEAVDKDAKKFGCSGDEMVVWKKYLEAGK